MKLLVAHIEPEHKAQQSVYLMPQRHDDIVPIVERFFKLQTKAIYNRTRKREIVEARQIVLWFEVKQNKNEWGQPYLCRIGEKFPNKKGKPMNHATVLHSEKLVDALMEIYPEYRRNMYKLQKEIFGEVLFVLPKNKCI